MKREFPDRRLGRALWLVAGLALPLPATSGETRPLQDPLYVLTTDGGGLGIFIDDTIVFSRVKTTRDDPAPFWIAERARTDRIVGRETRRHQWIDGRRCPALARVLAQSVRIAPPRPQPPEAASSPPPFDVPRMRFSAPAEAGNDLGGARMAWSGYGSAAFRWWADGETALKGCWSDSPVQVDGQPLRTDLDTPEAIRAFKSF